MGKNPVQTGCCGPGMVMQAEKPNSERKRKQTMGGEGEDRDMHFSNPQGWLSRWKMWVFSNECIFF